MPSDPTSVKLFDPDERKKRILDAVKKWQKKFSFIELIICDGSNICLKEYFENNLVNTKKIEFLNFQNNSSLVCKLGKGYGESEIIKYALENSKTLKRYSYFAKCTGKLWIDNFEKIVYSFNYEPYLFRPHFSYKWFSKIKIQYVDTRFFLVKKELYINNFLNLYSEYDCNDSVEILFLKKIKQLKLENVFFNYFVIISGVSGASGNFYNTKIYRILKDRIKYFFWKKSLFFKRPYLDCDKK